MKISFLFIACLAVDRFDGIGPQNKRMLLHVSLSPAAADNPSLRLFFLLLPKGVSACTLQPYKGS